MAIYNVYAVYSLPMVIIKATTSKYFIPVFTFSFNGFFQSSSKRKKNYCKELVDKISDNRYG